MTILTKISVVNAKNYMKDLNSMVGKYIGSNNSTETSILIFIIVLIILILIIIISWVYTIYTLEGKNCNFMDYLYLKKPTIYNIDTSNSVFKFKLYDYYIKTAYNCCSAGKFKNDFVSLCALKNCIKQGVRCLDMQIYSLNNKPVVATASFDDYNTKETYNSLPLSIVLSTIKQHAFHRLYCQNYSDPLIIHFRIMSNNKKIYNDIADLLESNLDDKLLSSKYSYENHNNNIGKEELVKFIGKSIICIDKTNPIFRQTKLYEYVNITSNSPFMRLVHYTSGIKLTPDMTETINYNKKHITLCLPDLNSNMVNPSFNISSQMGCQLTAMSFQNNDSNLQHYNEIFNSYNYAFILKPRHLREKITTVDVNPQINENDYITAERSQTIDFAGVAVTTRT
jgi:hypothetical protein